MQAPIWSCEPAAAIVARSVQKRSMKTVQSFELRSLQSEFYSSDEEPQKEDGQEVPAREEFELPAAKRRKNEDGSRQDGNTGNLVPSEVAEVTNQCPLTGQIVHTTEYNTTTQYTGTDAANTRIAAPQYLKAGVVIVDEESVQLSLTVLPLYAAEKYQSKDLCAETEVMGFGTVKGNNTTTSKTNGGVQQTQYWLNKDVTARRQRQQKDQNSTTSMAKSIKKHLADKANNLTKWANGRSRNSSAEKAGLLVQDDDITLADTIARFASQTPVQVNTVLIQQTHAFHAPSEMAVNADTPAVLPVRSFAAPCRLSTALAKQASIDNNEEPVISYQVPLPEVSDSPAKTTTSVDCDAATAAATVGDATEAASTIQFGSDACTDGDKDSVAANNTHAPGAVMKACKTLTRVVRKMVPQFKGVTSSIDMLFGPFSTSQHTQEMTTEATQGVVDTETNKKAAVPSEVAPTEVTLEIQHVGGTETQHCEIGCIEQRTEAAPNKLVTEITVNQGRASAQFVVPSIILKNKAGDEVCQAAKGSSGGGAPFAHVEVLNSPGYDHLHGTPPGKAVRDNSNALARNLAKKMGVASRTGCSEAWPVAGGSPTSSLWARWCACFQPDVKC